MEPLVSIEIPRERIAAFCSTRHIRKLGLFGSVLRDDFRPDSDVDVLIEFEPGKTPGFSFISIQEELSGLFGRPVDLVTFRALNPRIRDRVLASMAVLYDQG